jgi:hypothetical protein
MSETIIFRGTFIRYLDVRQGKEGGEVFARIHLSSEFTDTIRDKMDWDDPGECVTSARLTGELLAQGFQLTPADKNLKRQALDIIISDISDFQVVALKDDEGEVSGRQLRFIARSPGDGVAALIEQYIRRVGRHEGELRVSYEPQAKQAEMDLGQKAPAEKDTGCIACNADIPLMDGDGKKHASGVKCTRRDEPVLAAASAMGGTHQKGRKGGQIADPAVQ